MAKTEPISRVLAGGCVALGAGWVFSVPSAQAITIRADVPIETINHRSNRPRYRSIGRFDTDATRRSLAGTGTLVAPQWVLTAAHVMDGMSTTRFTVGKQEYDVVGWTAPPSYANDPTFLTDLALVKLDRPVQGVTPANLYRSDQSEVNRTAMILGYGYSGYGDAGLNDRTAQTLRLSTNRIEAVDSDHVLRTDFDTPDGSRNLYASGNGITRFEGGLTAGDSGGPAFIYDGSDFTLGAIGVYATDHFGGQLDGDYGEENGLLRIRPHVPWIDSVINGNAPDRDLFLSNARTYQTDLDVLLANQPDHRPVVGWQGDYNTGGQVEQGDLDQVLQNWGVDNDTNGVPTGWVNDFPTGQIEQTELDGVLENWGNSSSTSSGSDRISANGAANLDGTLEIDNDAFITGWVGTHPTGGTFRSDASVISANGSTLVFPTGSVFDLVSDSVFSPFPVTGQLPEPAAVTLLASFILMCRRR